MSRRTLTLKLASASVLLSFLGCSGQAGMPPGSELANAGGSTGASGGMPAAAGSAGGIEAGTGGTATQGTGGSTSVFIPTDMQGNGGSAGSAGSGAGSGGQAGGRMVMEECAASMAQATDMTSVVPADIIFAIDSSRSMNEEIAFVQTYMNEFSEQIAAAGVDARVILIGDPSAICIGAPLGSGMCPDDGNAPAYVHVPTRVDSRDGLNVIIDSYPQWSMHLRPEATKSFVIVSDDDATDPPNNSAAAFEANLTALDPTMFQKWSFNGVYCFTECAPAAAIGQVYVDLVASTEGVGGDLCLQDFQPVFDRLAEQIITTSGSEITCEWALPAAPMNQSFTRELVGVMRGSDAGGSSPLTQVTSADACAAGGWYFDSLLNPSKILACPSTCTELQGQTGGRVDITFGCEAVGSCVATDSSKVSNPTSACTWPLPSPPSGQDLELSSVNVRYTSPSGFATNLGKVENAADCAMFTDGWYFDDPAAPTQIVACPQTCSEVEAGGSEANVEVLFGCKSKPPIPR
jgi:hypothetical protein